MSAKYIKYSIIAGLITFALCILIFSSLDSPSPYIGGLVVGFIIFEIFFYHFFGKEMEKQKLL